MFIELHLIQNFSPANLNRDDTNNPKDCEFGGHRRARISSQAFKQAMRRHASFVDATRVSPGIRTKKLAIDLLRRMRVDETLRPDAETAAIEFARVYSSKKGKMDDDNPSKTSVLVFFAEQELDEIAKQLTGLGLSEVAAEVRSLDQQKFPKPETRINKSPLSALVKAWINETKGRTSGPDIALYGRMLADRPVTNIDAACQVAHAISTHRVNMEMDFYTAVDDLQTTEEDEGAGAGMMGFTNFNSSCFYRYACIDFDQLATNLGGDRELARRTVEGFLRAAIDAIPTGKQNSFAAQNPTSLALALVREDGKSWNLANAFEEPVRAGRETGIIVPSIEALVGYWSDLTERRDDAQFEAVAAWTDSTKHQQALNSLAGHHKTKLSEWIEAVTAALPKE